MRIGVRWACEVGMGGAAEIMKQRLCVAIVLPSVLTKYLHDVNVTRTKLLHLLGLKELLPTFEEFFRGIQSSTAIRHEEVLL